MMFIWVLLDEIISKKKTYMVAKALDFLYHPFLSLYIHRMVTKLFSARGTRNKNMKTAVARFGTRSVQLSIHLQ